ncbi:crosslink repair DNA glycosylase YcaQ family protein [Sanguibacter sp. 25GB23B1]|uniref:winged helix-turn-helix domain-containing protein n=1 Tax=unclassified Sanguibacter TaxID=2645534 RepID=UPI0032AF18EB
MTSERTMTLAQARRTALAAQGLASARPVAPQARSGDLAPRVTMAGLQRVVDRLGLLQIDSVNVLARAHLMPLFSRLGPYDTALLDRATSRAPRRLVEYWGHEASYLPPSTYRLLEWRQRRYRTEAWGSISGAEVDHSAEVREIRAIVRERGPVTAAEVERLLTSQHARESTAWGWNWSVAKRALEFLFFTGEVTAASRNNAFERRYDLTERVLPRAVLDAPAVDEDDAVRALVEIGARAHGVGTARCFADYFRLRGPAPRRALLELVEDGTLLPVQVRGWDRPTFVHRDARTPRRAAAQTLLSPFDPLVFERRRLAELFGTHYRIEIYVPAHKRVHGYYVLPFLEGDQITARVDLKADRREGTLRVMSAHRDDTSTALTPAALAAELVAMAEWLGMGGISVEPAGDLAADLQREVARAG